MNQDSQRPTETSNTHFAPAERASDEELRRNVHRAGEDPVIGSVMQAVTGLLAVLNEERQILAVNDRMLARLGIDDPETTLGLRLGEALHCVHACDEPGGCGTSRHCATCGAAIATVASLNHNRVEERTCVMTIEPGTATSGEGDRLGGLDLFFHVRSAPIRIGDERFLILLLQDRTNEQRRAALETIFFQDLSNMISALVVNSQLLDQASGERQEDLARRIQATARQLAQEIEIQKSLAHNNPRLKPTTMTEVSLDRLVHDIAMAFAGHPIREGKQLTLAPPQPEDRAATITTDPALLQRILIPMFTNAFEATPPGGEVRWWIELEPNTVRIHVWNAQPIPKDVALRVFQRNFTTKPGEGRGLGTYTMKHLAETYLHGTVTFQSTEDDGTTFTLRLPRTQPNHT